MKLDLSHARAHDLGGQPAGAVDPSEHEPEPWHRLVTAILYVLNGAPRRLTRIDELRRAIEDMPPEDYRRLDYFERWAAGLSTLVTEKGLMTREEIESRMSALRAGR